MAKKDEPLKEERSQQKSVNAGSVFWGILLIALGALFLLENLDIVQLHLENVWQLWPLLIVGVGVSLLNLKGALGVIVNVLLIAAVLGLAVIGVTNESGLRLNAEEATSRGDGHSNASIEKEDDSVERLAVDIKTGALELVLGSNPPDDKLVEAIKSRDMDPKNFGLYLQAFEFGMPPEGGFSFGLERITMHILGLSNVREASLFPRDMERIDERLSKLEEKTKK